MTQTPKKTAELEEKAVTFLDFPQTFYRRQNFQCVSPSGACTVTFGEKK